MSHLLYFLAISSFMIYVHGDTEFKETLNLTMDMTCSVREDWCFSLTIFTVQKIVKAPVDIYPRDKTFLQKEICSRTASARPKFDNVPVSSPFKEGVRVNYQLSHTCSTDGKPDCIVPNHPYYIPFDKKDYKFAPHEVGISTGRGECKD